MKLKPFILPERIVIGIQPGSQEDVLKQLSEPLISAGNLITSADKFLEDLLKREREVTTVMENGVAFPHTRSTAVSRLCLVIGLTPPDAPIKFNPEGEADSRLFFCIGVPAFAPTAHIPILQSLANFARDDKRVERLMKSKTPAQVVRKFATFKG